MTSTWNRHSMISNKRTGWFPKISFFCSGRATDQSEAVAEGDTGRRLVTSHVTNIVAASWRHFRRASNRAVTWPVLDDERRWRQKATAGEVEVEEASVCRQSVERRTVTVQRAVWQHHPLKLLAAKTNESKQPRYINLNLTSVNFNNNNDNEYIYMAQNKQSSDALTRATKQAGTEVSGKRRHRQWRYGHLVEKRAIRNMFRVWHAHDEMSSLEDKKCRTDRNQSKDVKLQYLSDRISFHFMKFISLFRNLVAHVINYFSTLTF